MAEDRVPEDYVVRLFLAYFERAPEYAALTYYRGVLDGLIVNASSAGEPPEAAYVRLSTQIYDTGSRFGEIPAAVIDDDAAFVSYIYRSILGRDADPIGQAYWTADLAQGVSRAEVVDAFLRAAATDLRDGAFLENRAVVAREFAQWENSNPGILDDLPYNAAEVLAGVTDDPATIVEAEGKLHQNQPQPPVPPLPPVPPTPTPEVAATFVLASGVDTFTGTGLGDTFLAPARASGDQRAATLQTGDRLDGRGGADVLEADLYGSTAMPTLTAIETLRVDNGHADAGRLDLSAATGYTTLAVLASTGEVQVTNVGGLGSVSVTGAQAGGVAIQGFTGNTLELTLERVSDGHGGRGTVWLGDDEHVIGESSPHVLGLEALSLTLRDNVSGVFLQNVIGETFRIDAQGTNRLTLDGAYTHTLEITGSGRLQIGDVSGLTGELLLYGSLLQTLDATGFDGQLTGITVTDADDPAFATGRILLGDGRQTVTISGAIAQGAQIHGSASESAWTTLRLTESAYASLATFDADHVSNIDAIAVLAEATSGTYALLHGASAFEFAGGIADHAWTVLEAGAATFAHVTLGGQVSDDYGHLSIASDAALTTLDLRLAQWAPSLGTSTSVSVTAWAQQIDIHAVMGADPLGGPDGSTTYTIRLDDVSVVPTDPSGTTTGIRLTGTQNVVLDIRDLGQALSVVDASDLGGTFEVNLTGFADVTVTATAAEADHWDTVYVDAVADAAGPSYVVGLSADDAIILRLSGNVAGWEAIALSADDLTLTEAYDEAWNALGDRDAGWFEWGDATYVLAQEWVGGEQHQASIAVQGTGLAFDADYGAGFNEFALFFL